MREYEIYREWADKRYAAYRAELDRVIPGLTDFEDEHFLKILQVLHQLHLRGYERLRICPMATGLGALYGVVTSRKHTYCENGALWDEKKEGEHIQIHWFTYGLFKKHSIEEIADIVEATFPELCEEARGEDPFYMSWFDLAMLFAERRGVFVADYLDRDFMRIRNNCGKLPTPPNRIFYSAF